MPGDSLNIKKILKNPLISGTLILTVASGISKFMGFFFRIFLNDTMGAAGLGLYQLVMPVISVCLALCCNGFQTAVSKLVAEKKENSKNILLAAIFLSSAAAIFISIILYKYANYISIYIIGEYKCIPLIEAASFSLLPACIHSCINGFYYGIRKTVIPSLTQLVEQSFRIGASYIIFVILSSEGTSFSPSHAIYGLLAGEIAATLFSITAVRKKLYQHNNESLNCFFQSIKDVFTLFIPLSLNYLLISLSSSIENTILPRVLRSYGMSSTEALDMFGSLNGLAMPVLLFPGMICACACTLLLPAASQAAASPKNNMVHSITKAAIYFGLFFGIFFTIIFFIFADFIGDFLFSSKLCGYFLKRLCWICPMMHISSMLCSTLQGLGLAKNVLLISILTCSIRIFMVFALVPSYGIDAYLWSLIVSNLFMTISLIISSFKIKS